MNLKRAFYLFVVLLTVLYFGKHIYRGVLDPRYQKVTEVGGSSGKKFKLKDGSCISLEKGSKFMFTEVFHEDRRKTELIGSAVISIEKSPVPFKMKLTNTVFISEGGELSVKEEGRAYFVKVLDGVFELEVYTKDGKLDNVLFLKQGKKIKIDTRVVFL